MWMETMRMPFLLGPIAGMTITDGVVHRSTLDGRMAIHTATGIMDLDME